jgi:SulP family sulfate permease
MSTPTRSFWLGSYGSNPSEQSFFVSPGRRQHQAQQSHGSNVVSEGHARENNSTLSGADRGRHYGTSSEHLYPPDGTARIPISGRSPSNSSHQHHGSHSGYDSFFRRREIITEDSEPGSPDTVSDGSPRPTQKSALTELLRNSPPETPEPLSQQSRETRSSRKTGSRENGAVESSKTKGRSPHKQHVHDENTPLLGTFGSEDSEVSEDDSYDPESQHAPPRKGFVQTAKAAKSIVEESFHLVITPKAWDRRAIWNRGVLDPIKALPAVFVGALLNVLDALSYGMILFPLGVPIFSNLGPDGISIFYISTIVSQLIYSLGASAFRGGIGSEMIEVVPFFHKMALTILAQVGEDNPKAVLATTILAFSLSSIVTGLVFFLLGACRMGKLMKYFPKHVLDGCIGGVGWFLMATAIEVAARLTGGLEYNLDTLKYIFQPHVLVLWTVPLAIAIVLKILDRFVTFNYFVPCYFIGVFLTFYIVVLSHPALSLTELRSAGWVFQQPEVGVPFWHPYTLFSLEDTDWKALSKTIPSMFALTFFGILHVPINVPALAKSTGVQDLDFDRELIAHGISNTVSGLAGSIQNYLVYSNSLLFIRSGGNSRLAGFLLAIATAGLLVAGPSVIGYVPILMVGALIFLLGMELLQEALIDSWSNVSKFEYFTVSLTSSLVV